MLERPIFITVHGIDGTGKTTTTEAITKSLEDLGVTTINYDVFEQSRINNPFSIAKKRVVLETSPSAQFAFFLGSTLYHSDQISNLLESGFSVVKSRYLDDVLAQHAYLGVEDTHGISRGFPIRKPGLKILLTLNEEERRKRISKRGIIDEKDADVRDGSSRLDFFEGYLLAVMEKDEHDLVTMKIDTLYLNPQQIASLAIENLIARRLLQI